MPARPNEEWQKIRQVGLDPEELDLDKATVRKQWLSNLWHRTVAFMVGWSGSKMVPFSVSSEGSISVVIDGSQVNQYDVKAGTAQDNFSATHQLAADNVFCRVDLLIETEDAAVRFRDLNDSAWGNAVLLPTGWYSFPIRTPIVQVRNRTAGSNTVYQIVGWEVP